MGQALSSATRRAGQRNGGGNDDSGPLGLGAESTTTTTSIQKEPRSLARKLRPLSRSNKQKLEERPVEFLPHPFEQPDSKPVDENNTLERLVHQVLQMYSRQRLKHLVGRFVLGAVVEFPGVTMDAANFLDFFGHMASVFPDFHFEYKLIGETSPGVVVAIIQACGTHTGRDYATPTQPTPMPPLGALCKNDPEYFTCTFQGHKIKHCSFLPVAQDTRYHGPDGFYQQIVQHNAKVLGQIESKTPPGERNVTSRCAKTA
jgi:hypothetical protein